RLRDEEGACVPIPRGGEQGQGDDHVPRARAVEAGARVPTAAATRRGRGRTGLRRIEAEAGRSQHGHGSCATQERQGEVEGVEGRRQQRVVMYCRPVSGRQAGGAVGITAASPQCSSTPVTGVLSSERGNNAEEQVP